MALGLRATAPDDLATYELRTSALHFQIKRLMGDPKDREKALKQCGPCPALIADMNADVLRGQMLARARLATEPTSEEAQFYLGKIDLNHVWLYLGTLGRRTGWAEYREARRSIEAVLKANPAHVRARVAAAWIEYIVDTRVPFGFKWVLGGGNKTKALAVAREAAAVEGDFYARAEAGFALWEMLVKDKKLADAVVVARRLYRDFPENRELVRFLDQHATAQGPER